MAGGNDGENGYVRLRADSDREEATGMVYESMKPGDLLVNLAGGGGGWGNPFKRDPQKVLADVKSELISVQKAKQDYGVAIDLEEMTIDTEATTALRSV